MKEMVLLLMGYDFDKVVNRISDENVCLKWIKETSSKARKKSIMEAENAYKRFFKGISGFPRFKRKNSNQSFYFIKDHVHITNRRIKVPILKWIKLKEYGYIPKKADVVSGRILKTKDGRYYVILIVDYKPKQYKKTKDYAFGIDVGIKDYLTFTNGEKIFKFKNINKELYIKNIECKIEQYQRIIAKKIEINKKRKRGEKSAIYNTKNIQKIRLKINKFYSRLTFIRNDYIKKICSILVKAKPRYITIEDLSNKDILIEGNKSLSREWSKCKFNYFREFLIWKCKSKGIELRLADKYYASSKTCSCCGHIKKNLKLKDRTYKCHKCGTVIDRDVNASINLLNTKEYSLAY